MKIQTVRGERFEGTEQVNVKIGEVVFRLSQRDGNLVINKSDQTEGKEASDVIWVRPYASNEILVK